MSALRAKRGAEAAAPHPTLVTCNILESSTPMRAIPVSICGI